MKTLTISIIAALILPMSLAAQQLVHVTATSNSTVILPGYNKACRVFAKPEGTPKPWQPLKNEVSGGKLKLYVNPAQCGGHLLLYINPPAGLTLDDFTAPVLEQFLVNGNPFQITDGNLSLPKKLKPDIMQWQFTDATNAIDPASLNILIDGKPVKADVKIVGKSASVNLPIAKVGNGSHVLTLKLADSAPEPNWTTCSVNFNFADGKSLIFAKPGLKCIKADSHYDGYNSLAPLTDGVLKLPGTSAGGDVTWASAENNEEHWVEITLNAEATLNEASIYWPRLENSSQFFELQVKQGDKWITLASAPPNGEKPTLRTTFVLKKPAKGNVFRLFQPPNGGPATRPGILWICEIDLR